MRVLEIRFHPDSVEPTLVAAAGEYQRLWESQGRRILQHLAAATGLRFAERSIEALVFEGVSGSQPLRLRASYDEQTKVGTLIHELAHCLIADNRARLSSLPRPSSEEHELIDLFLFDLWTDLYGEAFARRQVEIESRRRELYRKAWNATLAMDREARAARLRTVLNQGANDAAAPRPPGQHRAPTAETICAAFDLGRALAPLTPVEGGFSHRVWKLRTASGTFAVKQLNPTVIARPGALDRYRAAERVALRFREAGVTTVAALHVDDDPFRSVGGSWFLAYPWVDGEVIPLSRVTVDHAYAVGAMLGRIHRRDLADPRLPGPNMRTPSTEQWHDLAKRSEGQPWSKQLSDTLALLVSLSAASAAATEALRDEAALVSHRDLVPENVLWNAKTAWLIDWESAAWTNPMVELVAAAIDWSGYIEGRSDRGIFDAVLDGYRAVAPFDPSRTALALPVSSASWLRWLAYNVTRALGETVSGDADRALGVSQTFLCLEAVVKIPIHQPLWREWIAGRT